VIPDPPATTPEDLIGQRLQFINAPREDSFAFQCCLQGCGECVIVLSRNTEPLLDRNSLSSLQECVAP
jgi:hypothetical protein